VLFRLMLESGVVKLTWDDPSWSLGRLDALTWHYWTQPLPPATAWWFDGLPLWFHQASAAGMYAVELIAPFAIFGPRRARLAAAAAMAGLQVVLLVSGNYGFFNLLTLVLVLPVLDDGVWPARLRGAGDPSRPSGWRFWAPAPFAALVLLVNVPQMFATFRVESGVAEALRPVARAVAPFETVNAYGLFRVMTKERREIVIEGSDDGVAWKAYEFRWKPGDPMRRPEFTTPHMPRLDWQMWFAAFGPPEQSPWFGALEDRLLEGSPEVLALFAANPFPDRPPRYVRSLIYDYRFADREMREETGAWWSRGLLGTYDPPRSR